MSDLLIALSVALTSLFLTDPFYGGALAKSALAKFSVLGIVSGALALHFIARAYVDSPAFGRARNAVIRAWWPIIALGLFVTAGSLYAREVGDVNETFLNLGLGMLYLPLMALAVEVSGRKELLLKSLLWVYVVTAMTMYVVAGAQLHTLHEQIFWAVPLGMYLLTARRVGPLSALLGITLVALSLLAFKNTTFLLVVMCLFAWVLLVFARMRRHPDPLKVLTAIYFTTVLTVSIAIALGIAWWFGRDQLPHGNTEYRMEMYGIAWRRFLDSPLWGNLFTEPSVTYFSLYKVAVGTNLLPTHSDVLDLMAHGGLIALALWLMTMWRIGHTVVDSFKAVSGHAEHSNERAWRWLFVLGLTQVGAFVTYAVNPPLIRLVDGFWIWGGAGVMWALHRHLLSAKTDHVPVSAEAPRHLAWGIKPMPRRRAAVQAH